MRAVDAPADARRRHLTRESHARNHDAIISPITPRDSTPRVLVESRERTRDRDRDRDTRGPLVVVIRVIRVIRDRDRDASSRRIPSRRIPYRSPWWRVTAPGA